MHRFYLPPDQCRGERLSLTDREAHHALHVLRLRKGESVVVLDGAGKEYSCSVIETSRDAILLEVSHSSAVPPLPWSLTLIQAIPKAKIIESIIQKATELGVARVIPLLSERVVTQVDSESGAHKAARWQHVAIEAMKQSGNAWLPRVEAPVTVDQLLKSGEQYDLQLIGSLRESSKHPREYISRHLEQHGKPPQTLCVWVGPEGDFTADEYDAAERAGAWPISLGRLVLRSETAATYCLAALSYEMQWHHSAVSRR